VPADLEVDLADNPAQTWRMRTLGWLESLAQDVRDALRGMRRSPAFTLVAVMTLAIGIGVNATVFTLTNAALFKGFRFVVRNDRLLYITSRGYGCCVSYPDFADWRAQAKSFERMAVVHGTRISLSDTIGFPESYDATEVSADTFALIGQRPMIGRDFTPSDEIPGAAPVAILNYGFWERRYGKDAAIIGQTVRINGTPTTVIGVMAQGFSFPQKQDLWVPLVPTPAIQKREARNLWVAVGRMADGVTLENARAEMDIIGRRLASAYPLTNQGQLPVVQNFHEFFIGPNATLIYASLLGAVGCVLLIACANLANLTLARATSRSREISVRIALGAGRWRIIRQLLAESVMLSAAGGVVAWWIVEWGVRTYELADRPWRVLDYAMDYRIFAYFIAISVGTGVLFGLAPALRLSTLDVNAGLKDGGRGAAGGGRGTRVSALLVIGEMALAVVLLSGAGVMIRSFLVLHTLDVGVPTANTLAMQVELPDDRYPGAESKISFFDRLTTRLEAIPGVESIAIAARVPAGPALKFPYELAGAAPIDAQRRPIISGVVIGSGYFRTVGVPVRSGREFNDADGGSAVPVAIVNQRFANSYWPGEEPLGKRLRVFDGQAPGSWLTVVGIAPNIIQDGAARQEFDPLVYLPYRQRPLGGAWVLARTRVPTASLGMAVRREIQALDADLPTANLWTLAAWLELPYVDQGNLTVLFLVFAAIALLLASIGLYAVVAHSVSQRTQEIGVRIAIGATARDILALVLMQGMLPLGIGLTVGLAASLALTPVLKSQLVRVSPVDPLTLVVTSCVLVSAATLGCMIPARRAMRVDPVVALRHD
jgi:putative ABC transport system permease protein